MRDQSHLEAGRNIGIRFKLSSKIRLIVIRRYDYDFALVVVESRQ